MSLPRYLAIALLLLGVLILSACRPITRAAVTPVATVKARPVVAAQAPKLVAVENGQAIFSASRYYTLSCVDWINVYWLDNGTWKNVDEILPSGYSIHNGKPVDDWDCDVVMCSPIEEVGLSLIKVRLDRYEQIRVGADTYPGFRAVPISGEAKVTIDLYGDNRCWWKNTFEFIVNPGETISPTPIP